MNPTAAEMLKWVPVKSSAQMPPQNSDDDTGKHEPYVNQRMEGEIEQHNDHSHG